MLSEVADLVAGVVFETYQPTTKNEFCFITDKEWVDELPGYNEVRFESSYEAWVSYWISLHGKKKIPSFDVQHSLFEPLRELNSLCQAVGKALYHWRKKGRWRFRSPQSVIVSASLAQRYHMTEILIDFVKKRFMRVMHFTTNSDRRGQRVFWIDFSQVRR